MISEAPIIESRRPFTGAWIETVFDEHLPAPQRRPFTGAWIETAIPALPAITSESPLHGGVD